MLRPAYRLLTPRLHRRGKRSDRLPIQRYPAASSRGGLVSLFAIGPAGGRLGQPQRVETIRLNHRAPLTHSLRVDDYVTDPGDFSPSLLDHTPVGGDELSQGDPAQRQDPNDAGELPAAIPRILSRIASRFVSA